MEKNTSPEELSGFETLDLVTRQNGKVFIPEDLFKIFVKNVPAGVAMLDRNMRYLVVSDRFGADYFADREQLIGLAHYEVFPDIPERWKEAHRSALSGDTLRMEEDRWERNGHTIWVRWEVRPWKTQHGEIGGILILAEDITQRKTAEEALRESGQRFRLLMDTAPAMIWKSGTDKLCDYVNKTWLEFTGRAMEDEIGDEWTEGIHQDDQQRCLETFSKCFDAREKFRMEYRLRRHDGEYRWVLDLGVPRFNHDGSFAGYIGVAVDITEQKEAESALREREERLRLGQWVARVGTFDWNIQTGVNFWTPELEAMYGLPQGSFAGTLDAFVNLIHEDDRKRVLNLTYESLETGRGNECEWRAVWPDGSIHWIAGRGEVLRSESGDPLRMIGVNIDITERKLVEQALSEMTRKLIAAQEQERTRIGRELHDDIGQRLALLSIDLEQLKERPSELQIRAKEVRSSVDQLSADVEALSHDLHSGKLEYLGVAVGIRSWCKEFASRRNLEIDFDSSVENTIPFEIGVCLFRVLQESLQNAVKHSGVKHFDVQLLDDSGEIHLVIHDSGRGFELETARQGHGLGLISMQERVRLVGGTIVVDSKPLGGTTIDIRVPYQKEARSQQAAG